MKSGASTEQPQQESSTEMIALYIAGCFFFFCDLLVILGLTIWHLLGRYVLFVLGFWKANPCVPTPTTGALWFGLLQATRNQRKLRVLVEATKE